MKKIKILLTGSNGQLGKEFSNFFSNNGNFELFKFDKLELDITNLGSVIKKVKEIEPSIIINCAADNLVDNVEKNFYNAFKVNSIGPYNLAYASKELGILLIHFSSDYVFDGEKNEPYIEEDTPNPINKYGESKLFGELLIKNLLDKYLIFRLSWVYGKGEQNFINKLESWSKNKTVKIVTDEVSVPTSTRLIVEVVIQAIENKIIGLYHLTCSGQCSRYELAEYFYNLKNININLISGKKDQFKSLAKRPDFSVLSNNKLSLEIGEILNWKEDLLKYIK